MIEGVDITFSIKEMENLILKFFKDGHVIQLSYNMIKDKSGCIVEECQYFFDMKPQVERSIIQPHIQGAPTKTKHIQGNTQVDDVVFCFMFKSCFSDPMNLFNKKILYQEFLNNFIKKDSFIKYDGNISNEKDCEIHKFQKISIKLYPKNYSPFMKYTPTTTRDLNRYIDDIKAKTVLTNTRPLKINPIVNADKPIVKCVVSKKGSQTTITDKTNVNIKSIANKQNIKTAPNRAKSLNVENKENLLKLKELLCDIFA
jgi:hypothetical protein